MYTCPHCNQEFTKSFAFYCPRCDREVGHVQANNGMIDIYWLDGNNQPSKQYKQMTVRRGNNYPNATNIIFLPKKREGGNVKLTLDNNQTIVMEAVKFFEAILSNKTVIDV